MVYIDDLINLFTMFNKHMINRKYDRQSLARLEFFFLHLTNIHLMVEPIGIEPTTSWMQIRRSPKWATAPHLKSIEIDSGPGEIDGGPGKTWTSDLTLIKRAL